MAIDYEEGFLETIKDIHFGSGKWMSIEMVGKINGFAVTKMQVDLRDQAGGTPGFVLFDGTQVGGGQALYLHAGGPTYPILAPYLKANVQTNAGASFGGFGFYKQEAFAIPQTFLFLKLDGRMPHTSFRIRCQTDIDGGPNTSAFNVRTFKKIKAGETVYPSQQVANVNTTKPTGAPVEFRINPVDLSVALT